MGMFAYQPCAYVGVARLQRYAQRRYALFDNARFVFVRQIRERHERAHEKAQSEIVVAQRERRAHARRQLAHEAKGAGVSALLHVVENEAVEFDAPVLTRIAP